MNLQITHTIGGKNPQPLFVNTGHDSTFEKFKNLVSSLTKTKIESVRYEDEDGDLITVESEPEFEEIKKLGSRQVKVFVDASPIVVEKPKAWGPELISFTTAPEVVAAQLPSTMEALAKPPPEPQVRVMPTKVWRRSPVQPVVQPAPAFKAVNVIKPTPVVPTSQPVHNAYCDHCNATIVGIRYKCANCPDYDLCESCEAENVTKNYHDQKHIFLKIRSQIRSGMFSPLPNLYECRGFHHQPQSLFNPHALCNQRLNALETKVNLLLSQNKTAAPAPVPVPVAVPLPVKTAEEKLEERRQKREKAKQEREAKKEQRVLLKQKKIQEKQEKIQKLQAAKQAQQAAAAAAAQPAATTTQQLNLGEIPVVLKVEEVKVEEVKPVEVPVKVEAVVEATVTIEEVEDEFHQHAKEQPVVVEAKVEEVVVEKKEEKSWNEIAEEFVQVPKEEEPHPYAAQLNILQDMGFSAVGHLSELLKQFNGDLQAVLQSILA